MAAAFQTRARRAWWIGAACALTALGAVRAVAQEATAPAVLKATPAVSTRYATKASMFGVAHAGKRLVAVGDYGIVLLSDDDGRTFRQARSVPVSSTLTEVSFVDAEHGWAVGHWGVILKTDDGGEHWVTQRLDTHVDQPLFSVHFFNNQEGVAVGLWSLILHTGDGGKTWQTEKAPPPPGSKRADRNLFHLFLGPKGDLFVSAERGLIMKSDDHGQTWQATLTGGRGSLWTGITLPDGVMLVGGLQGEISRSIDDGQTWTPVPSGSKSSVTALLRGAGGVIGVGLDGTQLVSADEGRTFHATQRADRLSYTTATLADDGALVRFSVAGVVPAAK